MLAFKIKPLRKFLKSWSKSIWRPLEPTIITSRTLLFIGTLLKNLDPDAGGRFTLASVELDSTDSRSKKKLATVKDLRLFG